MVPAESPISDLFMELVALSQEEGVNSFEQYRGLVDALIEEKSDLGYFSDDEDLPQIKENLIMRWPEIQESL